MGKVEKGELWERLKGVALPGFEGRNVIGLVRDLAVDSEGHTRVALGIAHLEEGARETIVASVREALEAIGGVEAVAVEVVAMAPSPSDQTPAPSRRPIRHIIAVGSGKGGVGKSTVSVNLAVALADSGLRVGLLDADVFGPNVPRMLGVDSLPESGGRGRIVPAKAFGVKLVSVGLMVQPEKAVIWRGPMTDKILRQFLFSVDWGELDVLVVDLPPGTGDIAISLARHAEPDGAIIVVTPQEVALDDGRKAVGMFRRLEVPVLGVVENMSYFICEVCETRHLLFGEGGGERLADELGVPLLIQIPMESHVREGGDSGRPAALRSESGAGEAIHALARRVARTMQLEGAEPNNTPGS